MSDYRIAKVQLKPEIKGRWDGPAWSVIAEGEVGHYRAESSPHRPVTRFKLQTDTSGLYGIFKVQDRFVRCVHADFQSDVYRDSCVEIFLKPKPEAGYFNFEFNCGGALLAYYITDPTKAGGRLVNFTELDKRANLAIRRFHSLPQVIEPEQEGPTTWYLEFYIPFSVMEAHVGPIIRSQPWSGNLYKCGDETSHPHWASWAPLDALNFHSPQNFGSLTFS